MRVRRIVAALTATLLLGVLAPVVFAAPAVAANNCNLGGFEIDGNTPQNCVPARDDWANQPGTALGTVGSYSAASKDTLATSTWTTAAGAPANNLSINNATSFQRTGSDGHVYLYVRWDRTATNGTGKYAVEVTNAGGVVVAGAPQPDRSLGGVVAYLQFQGGSVPTLGQFCTYTSQANYPTSVNPTATGCITNPPNTSFANGASASGAFLEVGFDLTALGISTPSCAATADTAALYVRSMSGNEASGNLAGFRPPVAITAPSTCGTLDISKVSMNELATDDTTVFDYEVGVDGADPVVEDSLLIDEADSFQVAPGTGYSITESIPDGAPWSLWSVECTVGNETVVLVDDGEPTGRTFPIVTGMVTDCVIVNATSFLTIVKATTPDEAEGVFSFDVDETEDAFSLSDGESETLQFAPGTVVSVVERLPEGWDLDTVDCGQATSTPITGGVDVTTSAGSTVTCTFGNEQRGTVNITKASLGDLATDDPTDFEWAFGLVGEDPLAEGDLEVGDSDQVVNVLPGDGYTIEETIPAGAPWVLWSIECSIGTEVSVTIVDDGEYTGETIPVQPGETTECVITNATSFLTILKATTPDDSDVEFSFNIGTTVDAFALSDGESNTMQFAPDTVVSVVEQQIEGWDLNDIDCGQASANPIEGGVDVTTSAGNTVTCTFGNEQRGTVNISKVSLNNLAEDDDTTFEWEFGDGGTDPLAEGDLEVGDSDQVPNVLPGDGYTLEETIPDGAPWVLWSIECTIGTEVSVTIVDDGEYTGETIPVEPGQTTDCVITNATSIVTVQKQTIPDGATGTFDFDATGQDPFTVDAGAAQIIQYLPGTEVTITEDAKLGWDLDSVDCEPDGDPVAGGITVTTIAGTAIDCFFTNQQRGSINIAKASLNDLALTDTSTFGWIVGDGSETPVADGDLTIGASDLVVNVEPGSGYTLTEDEILPADAPWILWEIICTVDGETYTLADAGDVDVEATFPVLPGVTTECVITNATSYVTVEKQTTPDGSEQSFGFLIDNAGFSLSDGDSESFQKKPNTDVEVEETVPAGWDLILLICSGDAVPSENNPSGAVVTTAPGATSTCTFTNEQHGTIIIEKVVVGLEDSTFDYTGGLGAFSIETTGGLGDQAFTVSSGSYAVTETAEPGYDTTNLVCDTEDGIAIDTVTWTVTVELDPAEVVTCTFTNTERGQIVVQKATVPANYDQDFNFTFNGNQDFTLNDAGVSEWQSELLEPGTYTVTENTLPDGWTLGGISCGEVDGSTATIELEPGQTVTCVVTNNAVPGTATLTKSVTGVTDDYPWSFDVSLAQEPDGAPVVQQVSNTALPGSAVATWSNLVVGATYTLEEGVLPFGWTSEGIDCGQVEDDSDAEGFQFTVTPGFVLDCTLTNAADPAEVELTKTVSDINPDAEWSFDFTLDADEQSLTDADPVGDWADLLPGTEYTITEADVPGWTEGAITCVPNTSEVALPDADAEEAGYQFTATPGLVLTCTADNSADPADLVVTKTTVGGNGTFEFTVTQLIEEGDEFVDTVTTAAGTGNVVFVDLVPGYEYSVAETTVPEGWTSGALECVITDVEGDEFEVDAAGFDVQPGDLVECAITNTKQAMAVTGATVPLASIWAALLLLLGGGTALVLVARQRRQNA